MTQDDKNVQHGTVSSESGTVSTETGTQATPTGTETPPQPQPLTREEIQKMIAEEKEIARREIQSIKDKSLAEIDAAQRRARFAEQTSADLTKSFGELDPERAETIRLQTQLKAYQSRDLEEAQGKQLTVSKQVFFDGMKQSVTTLGVDPTDKRIDWAEDAPNPQVASQRILDSVAKIQKEEAKKVEDKRSQEVKDIEARLRKDLGIDSVDTSASPGAGVDLSKLSPREVMKLGLKEGTGKKKK